MNRHALIRGALEALALTAAPRWLQSAPGANGFVVTLHHVRPARPENFDPNALLSITPEFLDQFLGHSIARGWRFVSVDELVEETSRPDPRRIAVSLDDGYRDNAEHAWPVFRKHRVPFTIYVCPGFAERTAELWWEALARLIGSAESFEAPGDDPARMQHTRTPDQKLEMFEQWRTWLTTVIDETHQRIAIRALAAKQGLDLAALARELVMDWDEIRVIAADSLCSIGAHTMTHPALARLSAESASREIEASVERVTAEIGKRPTSLAFPYGYAAAAGPREAKLAQKAALTASFTTRPGYVPATGSRHGLPRVSINGLFQRVRYTDVLLAPRLWFLRNRVRKSP